MLKKINLKMILCCVAIVFGFVAAMMLFAPALKADTLLGEQTLKGSEIAFGKKENGTGVLAASVYMLPLFLALIGVVLSVLALLGKGGKIVPIVAAVCFLVAAVLFFLPKGLITPDLGKLEGDARSKALENFREGIKNSYDLAAGAIVGGIFSIIAACAAATPIFLKK